MKVRRISDASCLLLSLTIFSVSPATAAQSAPTGDQLAAIRAACADDAQKFCATVQPGGGRIVACLKEHKDSLSDKCRQAAGLPPRPSNSSAPGGASSPSTPPASAAAPVAPPADSHAKPAPPTKAAPPVAILGERFVQRSVTDAQQGGMTAVTVYLPEGWHFDGKIEWQISARQRTAKTGRRSWTPTKQEKQLRHPAPNCCMVILSPPICALVKSGV
jgi:hypothetical protein